MNGAPDEPKIYHITHVANLPSIIACGALWSDQQMRRQGTRHAVVGMEHIKDARLSLTMSCHPGCTVGDFVPFNFCPRSVMLYIIFMRNNAGLTYRDGQDPIVHLEADLRTAVAWADANGRRWAFTASNARAAYTQFFSSLDDLHQVDWDAVTGHDFRRTREKKQAEFLIHEWFPWHLVTRIGVCSLAVRKQVLTALASSVHQPRVDVQQSWYY